MDTVTLTIDGREITVKKGTTILQAALANGIQIPFYCYHPGLSVDGSCRSRKASRSSDAGRGIEFRST